MNAKKEVKALVNYIKNYVTNAGKTGCVVGVSGGVDSAVIACLCKLAFPKTTYGVSMPRYEEISDGDVSFFGDSSKRAEKLCKAKRIPLIKSPIKPTLIFEPGSLGPKHNKRAEEISIGNTYARMRMIVLYRVAEAYNSLVIGTDNLSENFIGYFTKFGDGGVDINPIGKYLKSEVYKLGKELGVGKPIMTCKPSAELWTGQTDEGELGFTYDQLGKVIIEHNRLMELEERDWDLTFTNVCDKVTKNTGIDREVVEKIFNMYRHSHHKRMAPPEYERKE